jgi:hypothetical protein
VTLHEPKLNAWLVEAYLWSRPNGSAALTDILDSPSLFPFRLPHLSEQHLTGVSRHLEVMRHGMDQDLIMLERDVIPASGNGRSEG